MFLDEPVNGSLEHESIINSDQPDLFVSEPARLASAGDARVHDVVRNEEERLELNTNIRNKHGTDMGARCQSVI